MLPLAIMSPLTLLGYLLVIDWVDLTPLNDKKRLPLPQQLKISLPKYLPLLFIAFAFATEMKALIIMGVLVAMLHLALYLDSCWTPYLWGASSDRRQPVNSQGAKSLPVNSRPLPHTEQLIEGIFVLVMIISAGVATLEML